MIANGGKNQFFPLFSFLSMRQNSRHCPAEIRSSKSFIVFPNPPSYFSDSRTENRKPGSRQNDLKTRFCLIFACLFAGALILPAQENDTRSVDDIINDAVKPFSSAVENVIFFSIPLSEEVRYANLFAGSKGRDSLVFVAEAPFAVTYESATGLQFNRPFRLMPLDDSKYELSFSANGKDVKNAYSFGEKISISDTIGGESVPFVFTVNKTGSPREMIIYQFQVSETRIPLVLVWLMAGAIIFTFYFRFVNFTHFKLATEIVRGKHSDATEKGEVSHFQALTAALSATVGLGNIAGVAIAITIGGPGATFWMIIAGFLGMSSKFVECTLGVKFRDIDENGKVFGGPMYYLRKGFANKGYAKLGRFLAAFFSVMCIGGSLGGGNMFQVNQSFKQVDDISQSKVAASELSAGAKGEVIYDSYSSLAEYEIKEVGESNLILKKVNANPAGEEISLSHAEVNDRFVNRPLDGLGWLFGLMTAILVAVVIIGGIKTIAKVTDKLVPFMIGLYVIAALVVVAVNIDQVGAAITAIFEGALAPAAIKGGIVGVLIAGFQRASFSNEAGIGSASIAHSAVKTNYAASEGLVSLLEPFIDTVVVCTMTAIVIVITGQYHNVALSDGIALTSNAFATVISWFPYVLALAVFLFAFSTMISWSYYGQQSWAYLFGKGKGADISFKILFCIFIVIGASMTLEPVIGFSDAMIFAMCFPNIFGCYFLLPVVKDELKKYILKIKSGSGQIQQS